MMEAIDLTFLELISMLDMDIAIYDDYNEPISREQASDMFFLVEEEPQTFYIHVELYH